MIAFIKRWRRKWLPVGLLVVLAIAIIAIIAARSRPLASLRSAKETPIGSQPEPPSLTLRPEGAWRAAGSGSVCAPFDAGSLWAYVQSIVDTSAPGPVLALHLHNNTNACGNSGTTLNLPNMALTLKVVAATPAGGLGETVLAQVTIVDPPAELAPGETVSLRVEVSGDFAPGKAPAHTGAHLLLDGLPGGPLTLSFPGEKQASVTALQHVEVSGLPLAPGQAAAKTTGPNLVGGIPVPAPAAEWSPDGVLFTFEGPTQCVPGTAVFYLFGGQSLAVATGPGILAVLPYAGGGGDINHSALQFLAAPAEATGLHVQTEVKVYSCSDLQHPLGTGTVSYDFPFE